MAETVALKSDVLARQGIHVSQLGGEPVAPATALAPEGDAAAEAAAPEAAAAQAPEGDAAAEAAAPGDAGVDGPPWPAGEAAPGLEETPGPEAAREP